MEKLKLNNLKSGMLLRIEDEYLIERYNQALELIINKKTKLKSFHIDAVGFSPEISEELQMGNYLNIGDINQNFIILTLEQKYLPIFNSGFTNKRFMFRDFIEDNEESIINITMKTVLFGEIEDHITKVQSLDDLIYMKNIIYDTKTPIDITLKSKRILKDITKINNDNELIFDSEFISGILQDIEVVGNPIKDNYNILSTDYKIKSFYTNHLGGLYLFRYKNDPKKINILLKDKTIEKKQYPDLDVNYIDFNKKNIINFLITNRLAVIFDENFYLKYFNNIKNKMDMILYDYFLNKLNIEINKITNSEKTKLLNEYFENIPKTYKELESIYKHIQNDNINNIDINNISIDTQAMLIRPSESLSENNVHLIRHLITNFDNVDFMRMYAFNKSLFFDYYKEQSETKKDYMIKLLLENYVPQRKKIKYFL